MGSASPEQEGTIRAHQVLPHSCSTGYINNSLSVFHIRDFEPHTKVLPEFNGIQLKNCR